MTTTLLPTGIHTLVSLSMAAGLKKRIQNLSVL